MGDARDVQGRPLSLSFQPLCIPYPIEYAMQLKA